MILDTSVAACRLVLHVPVVLPHAVYRGLAAELAELRRHGLQIRVVAPGDRRGLRAALTDAALLWQVPGGAAVTADLLAQAPRLRLGPGARLGSRGDRPRGGRRPAASPCASQPAPTRRPVAEMVLALTLRLPAPPARARPGKPHRAAVAGGRRARLRRARRPHGGAGRLRPRAGAARPGAEGAGCGRGALLARPARARRRCHLRPAAGAVRDQRHRLPAPAAHGRDGAPGGRGGARADEAGLGPGQHRPRRAGRRGSAGGRAGERASRRCGAGRRGRRHHRSRATTRCSALATWC